MNIIYRLFLLVIFAAIVNSNAVADSTISLIRDAETEGFLHHAADPILRAANLNPKNIKIYIVNDSTINSFVSGGQNIFVNTGLITKYSTPDALIGVLAHETGHIAAGHIARASEEVAILQKQMIISYLLGIGAMLSGNPDAGSAVILGGSQSYNGIYMKYSRTQEEAADKLAVSYLDKIHYPATGLMQLFESFKREEIGLKGDNLSEFFMSHPITDKRIDFVKAHLKETKISDEEINLPLLKQMRWILVKLEAFTNDPVLVIRKYQSIPNSDFKFYALAIANYRLGQVNEAINDIDAVIASNKNNGFLYELKAQILFQAGRLKEAVLNYHRALKLIPKGDNALVKISLSDAIIALNSYDKQLLQMAINYLKSALSQENDNPMVYRSLAHAYSQIGDKGRYYLALADFNLLVGEEKRAVKFAKLAKETLDKNANRDLIHADDIIDDGKLNKKTLQ